jgi:hypothetical protein
LEDPLRWKNRWNLFLITLPACSFTGMGIYTLFSMSFSAFAEELFFRGYLMRRYSNLIVSFMFTFPHLLLYQNLQSVLTFFPSLLFGIVYQKTQSLIFVSLLHLYSNLVYRYLAFLKL